MNNIFFSIVLGVLGEFIRDTKGFADGRGFDRADNFGLGHIYDDSFDDREIICAPLDELGALGGSADREKMKERLKNTTGIHTPVLTIFQFSPGGFNSFPTKKVS